MRLVDLIIVVPIDDNGIPAKGGSTLGIGSRIPSQFGFTALTQTVDVEDSHQVVQLVVRGMVKCFPLRALGHLAISQQNPDVIGQVTKVLTFQRNTYPNGKALTP